MARVVAFCRVFPLIASACFSAACSLPVKLLPPIERGAQATATPETAWLAIDDGLEWRTLIPDGDALAHPA